VDYQAYGRIWGRAYNEWLATHETFQRFATRLEEWVRDYCRWALDQAKLHADAAIAAARAEGTL
jgi:hypothetical protein